MTIHRREKSFCLKQPRELEINIFNENSEESARLKIYHHRHFYQQEGIA